MKKVWVQVQHGPRQDHIPANTGKTSGEKNGAGMDWMVKQDETVNLYHWVEWIQNDETVDEEKLWVCLNFFYGYCGENTLTKATRGRKGLFCLTVPVCIITAGKSQCQKREATDHQGFSTFLILWLSNALPHTVVTPGHKTVFVAASSP